VLKRLGMLCIVLLVSCTGLPDNVEPVSQFDTEQYLGTWYEIARLDHSFERNLERVTATYGLNEDGSISVLNKGFNTEKDEWRQAEGVAKPMGSSDIAHLKGVQAILRTSKCPSLGRFMEHMRCLNSLTITATRLFPDTTPIIFGY